jgi:hypothetical protein
VAAFALLASLGGCTSFPSIEADECGNGVLERDEDCDTFVNKLGTMCRGPGVVGACHYDCTAGADETRPICPDGMGCSSDGICREATGQFDAAKLLSSDLSSWVSAADFDGDGHMDVISSEPEDQLQQSRFRIHYFDADTRLEETRTFPRATTRPLARRLDPNSKTDDLVFSNFRVGMMLGRGDRSFLPATFSSYVVDAAELRAVSVSDTAVNEEGVLGIVVFTKLKGKVGIYVPVRNSAQLEIRVPLDRPISQLLAPPLGAPLVTSPDSPCDEVVYGWQSERTVHVLDMCELANDPLDVENKWREQPRQQDVSLPAGHALAAPPIAADVDGDEHLDLLLNDGQNTYVSYGDGEALESEASLLVLPLPKEEGEDEGPYELSKLLAAGDVTGDGAADFVIPLGVIGSRLSPVDGSTVYFETFANTARPWTTAFVGDLNANGFPDVVAATEGADGLSFVNGSGGPFALGSSITTRGPVRYLTTGDFDGDLIGDVAYIEGNASGSSDLLTMAYGKRDEVPLEPVRVAEVSDVQQLGRQRSLGVDDVFTTSLGGVGEQSRGKYTLFAGDTSRLPFAPYSLINFSDGKELIDEVAPALILGRFSKADQDDVLALGARKTKKPWDLWLLPNIVAGNDPPQILTLEDDARPTLFTTGDENEPRLAVAGAAADLDGDGLDEALWLMPGLDGRCTLLVYSVNAKKRRVSSPSQLVLDAPCGSPQLATRDLNTDGSTDLVVLVGDGAGSPRTLQILWNDRSGGFSLDDRSFVTPPVDEDVRAFSLFPKDEVTLAFVTESYAFTARSRTDSRVLIVTQLPVGRFEDLRSLVVTDPNGDGFWDMVLADASGLWLSKAELK